jgi:IS66 C-terminal element
MPRSARRRRYSLVRTAKLNGINPQAYLADALARIADRLAKRIANYCDGIASRSLQATGRLKRLVFADQSIWLPGGSSDLSSPNGYRLNLIKPFKLPRSIR